MKLRTIGVLLLAALLGGCISVKDSEEEVDGNGDGGGPLVSKPVPLASITVDGSVSDWGDIAPVIADGLGDVEYSGLDIENVFVAQNDTHIFIRLDRGGTSLPLNEYSNFWVYLRPAAAGKKGYAASFFHSDPYNRDPRLWDISANPDDYYSYVELFPSWESAFGTTVEFAIPKSAITMEENFHLSFYTHHTVSYGWQDNGDVPENDVDLDFTPDPLSGEGDATAGAP